MLMFEATKEDLQQLYEIEKVCFSHPWSKDSLLAELTSQHTICLGAKVGETTVGFCLLSVIAGEGTVLQVAVLPEYRRKEIGKQLTVSAMEQARKQGAEVVFLEVRVSNVAARGLYKALGFEEISVRKGYYRDGETAMIMQWREQNENSGD